MNVTINGWDITIQISESWIFILLVIGYQIGSLIFKEDKEK